MGDCGTPLKLRADQLAVEQGLCASRSQAQRMIAEGTLCIAPETPIRKPGQMVAAGTQLCCLQPLQYVSRGAGKLLPALAKAAPPIQGATCLDIGASTGGFTDVLLQAGAAKVYAVDVGYGQLHEKLRADRRVVNLEHTNARDLSRQLIPDPVDILVGDVSFISLTKVLPSCAPLLASSAWIFVLVKPQFEAGRDEVGSGGVVRSNAVRQRCVETIVAFAERELHWRHLFTLPSPVLGPNGNQEFVAAFRSAEAESAATPPSQESPK